MVKGQGKVEENCTLALNSELPGCKTCTLTTMLPCFSHCLFSCAITVTMQELMIIQGYSIGCTIVLISCAVVQGTQNSYNRFEKALRKSENSRSTTSKHVTSTVSIYFVSCRYLHLTGRPGQGVHTLITQVYTKVLMTKCAEMHLIDCYTHFLCNKNIIILITKHLGESNKMYFIFDHQKLIN